MLNSSISESRTVSSSVVSVFISSSFFGFYGYLGDREIGDLVRRDNKYEEEFKDGIQNGHGIKTWSYGSKYVGDFKNGNQNGHGIFKWFGGREIVGEFKDGTQNGQATLTLPDGTRYEGEWKKGKEWNIIEYDKKGKMIGKFVNGLKK